MIALAATLLPVLVVDGFAIATVDRGVWRTIEKPEKTKSSWSKEAGRDYKVVSLGSMRSGPKKKTLRDEDVPFGVFIDDEGPGDDPDRRVLWSGSVALAPVKILSTDNATYRGITARYLRSRGVRGAKVRITRLVSTDLDRDGSDEVIIEASSRDGLARISIDGTGLKATDYSLILLRTVRNGRVQEIPLRWSAGKESGQDTRLRAIADLDGDRRMEVVLGMEAWEAWGAEVWSFRAGKARMLVQNGTGV